MNENKDVSIIVLSDLHIGGRKGAQFKVDPVDFQSYLDSKLQEAEKIILLGDIIDLYDTNCCCQSKEQWLAEIRRDPRYKDLINYLFQKIEEGRIIYIYGNHDDLDDAKEFEVLLAGAKKSYNYTCYGRIVHFEHGHLVDKPYQYQNTCYCSNCCCPRGARCMGDFLYQLKRCFTCDCAPYEENDALEKIGLQLAKDKGYDAVVFGHTHYKIIIKDDTNNIMYVNTGSVCNKDNDFDETTITFVPSGIEGAIEGKPGSERGTLRISQRFVPMVLHAD